MLPRKLVAYRPFYDANSDWYGVVTSMPGLAPHDFLWIAREGVVTEIKESRKTMASITKQDLIKKVVVKTGKTNRDVTEIVGATLDAIRESLESGDEVRLINFGVFSVKESAARPGVNPKTREKMEVPAKMRVKFAPGKELNDAVGSLTTPAK